MNKPKSQRITPATMTGEQIADAILYGTYTKTALWSFISEMVVRMPHTRSTRNWPLHFIS
jgi:hypothetical protein